MALRVQLIYLQLGSAIRRDCFVPKSDHQLKLSIKKLERYFKTRQKRIHYETPRESKEVSKVESRMVITEAMTVVLTPSFL